MPPEYLMPAEVAALLRLSVKSIYRLADEDPTMPALRLSSGTGGLVTDKLGRERRAAVTLRFHAERLRRWLRDREQGPSPSPRMPHQLRAVAKSAPAQERADG